MSSRGIYVEGLVSAMLSGEWSRDGLLRNCAIVAGNGGRWLRALVNTVLRHFHERPANRRELLIRFVMGRKEITEGRTASRQLKRWLPYAPEMGAVRWPVKRLDTLADVAQWLSLGASDLDWLADRKGLERTATQTRVQNYRYVWLGSRLIEAPKQQLMHAQRKVLNEILTAIPPHDAAHGFRAGRSVLTHARLHAGCEVVLRFDLRAFFTHVSAMRAHVIFTKAGYPDEVAHTLTGLCTNRAPAAVVRKAPYALRGLLAGWHLPQGAPTSPALANLAAWSLDVRLSELARKFGANYSRYADDLVFSGDDLHRRAGLQRAVSEIAKGEGFVLNGAKTRLMTSSRRQLVTGAVVNRGVNVARDDYDALKATLHNCVKHGLESQARGRENFRAHLEGRVGWVESLSPRRGKKLRGLLDQLSASASRASSE